MTLEGKITLVVYIYFMKKNAIFILVFRSMFDISESGSKPPNSEEIGSGSTFGQKSFEVDHSFLFLVWDYYSGMLLLMGRVINPLED